MFFNKINIGIRHILPIYPFLVILASHSFYLIKNKYIFFLLLIWYFLAFISVFPFNLTYFNELIGGPINGPKALLDSNIDWGQDLKFTRDYINNNQIKEFYYGRAIEENSIYPFLLYIDSNKIINKPFCYQKKIGTYIVNVNTLYALYGVGPDANYSHQTKIPPDLTIYRPPEDCYIWLRNETPIHIIGNSVYVYNLTE